MRNEPNLSFLGQLYLYFNPKHHNTVLQNEINKALVHDRLASKDTMREAVQKSNLSTPLPRRFIRS